MSKPNDETLTRVMARTVDDDKMQALLVRVLTVITPVPDGPGANEQSRVEITRRPIMDALRLVYDLGPDADEMDILMEAAGDHINAEQWLDHVVIEELAREHYGPTASAEVNQKIAQLRAERNV